MYWFTVNWVYIVSITVLLTMENKFITFPLIGLAARIIYVHSRNYTPIKLKKIYLIALGMVKIDTSVE